MAGSFVGSRMQAKTWGMSLNKRLGVWAAGVAALVCYLSAPAVAATSAESNPVVKAKATVSSRWHGNVVSP